MSTGPDVCRGRLELFLHRELAGWEGLPEGCTEQDVARWLPLRQGEGIAHLGSERVEYRYRMAEVAGFTEPVQLYFRDQILCLVWTGLWSTDRTAGERLLQDLGDPPDRLDLGFGMGVIPGGEWVYAARGLMLGVSLSTGLMARVACYPPCSVVEYRRCLHHTEPVREFPGLRER